MYKKSEVKTALPVYLQISEVLIREIAAGRLVDGQRLPPEREFAKQHGTTVRTLRKALAHLEEKGLLVRVQGSGNYIQASAQIDSVYSMFRLELLEGGGLPTAEVLSIDELEKPSDLPNFGASDRATRIRRLRYLNKVPCAVEEIWLDLNAGRVEAAKLSDSLYRYYKIELGFWITHAEDHVSVGRAPDWAPANFGKQPQEVVGFFERVSWAGPRGAVECSRNWFDPDQAHYVQRLK